MIHFLVSWLWESLFAQVGVAGLVLLGAIAVFVWVPAPGVRHLAVAVASVCLVFLFLAPKLYFEGIHHERAVWEAKVAAEEKRAADARSQAEHEIPQEIPAAADPPPGTDGYCSEDTNVNGEQNCPAAAPPRPAGVLRRFLPARRGVRDKFDRDAR